MEIMNKRKRKNRNANNTTLKSHNYSLDANNTENQEENINRDRPREPKCNDEFLREVYIQCNTIYLEFVNFRYQLLATFVYNAALFVFIYDKRHSLKLDIMISFIGIFIAWVMFFIDRRNRHIFKRVIQKAKLIEIYYNVPEEMRIHSKSKQDLKNKVSHSLIFIILSIGVSAFWVAYLVYCFATY